MVSVDGTDLDLVADGLHRIRLDAGRRGDHLGDLGGGDGLPGVGLELQRGAAGEVDAELESAEDDQQDRGDHQDGGHRVVDLAVAQDVERAGAGRQLGEEPGLPAVLLVPGGPVRRELGAVALALGVSPCRSVDSFSSFVIPRLPCCPWIRCPAGVAVLGTEPSVFGAL